MGLVARSNSRLHVIIEAAYKEALKHRWYLAARHIMLCDYYSFDRTAPIKLDPFMEIHQWLI
jgi:hypothetical protein